MLPLPRGTWIRAAGIPGLMEASWTLRIALKINETTHLGLGPRRFHEVSIQDGDQN